MPIRNLLSDIRIINPLGPVTRYPRYLNALASDVVAVLWKPIPNTLVFMRSDFPGASIVESNRTPAGFEKTELRSAMSCDQTMFPLGSTRTKIHKRLGGK